LTLLFSIAIAKNFYPMALFIVSVVPAAFTLRDRVRDDSDPGKLPDDYPSSLADTTLHHTTLSRRKRAAMKDTMNEFLDLGLNKQEWAEASQYYHPHICYCTFDRKGWFGRETVHDNLQVQFDMMKGGSYNRVLELDHSGSRVTMRAANTWKSKSGKSFTCYIQTSFYCVFEQIGDVMVAFILLIVDTGNPLQFYRTIANYIEDDTLHGGDALMTIMGVSAGNLVNSLIEHVPSVKHLFGM
jgi:hypothetical protein